MKKFISLMAVLAMVFSFSINAFAATAVMTMESGELEVAEGTQDIELDVTFTLSEAIPVYGVALDFALPEGVTLKSVDFSNLTAVCPTATNDLVQDLPAGKATLFEGTTDGTSAVSSMVVPCTLTVDTTVAKTYTIAFEGETGIADVDSYENINDSDALPTATITVKGKEVPKTDVTVSAPAVSFTEKFEKDSVEYYHGGALLEFTVNSETNNEVQFVTVTANDGTNTNTKKIDLKTKITSGTVKVGLNILNVPTEITTITLSNIVTSAN